MSQPQAQPEKAVLAQPLPKPKAQPVIQVEVKVAPIVQMKPKEAPISTQMFHDSTVLDTDKAKALVASFVKETYGYSAAAAVKCYQGTKDGWGIDPFSILVDGKGPNIVLIKSENGRTFGGFTSLSWKRSDLVSPDFDCSAFLFSVDEKNKYKNRGVYGGDIVYSSYTRI